VSRTNFYSIFVQGEIDKNRTHVFTGDCMVSLTVDKPNLKQRTVDLFSDLLIISKLKAKRLVILKIVYLSFALMNADTGTNQCSSCAWFAVVLTRLLYHWFACIDDCRA
jgi:hypothetical protein